MVIQHQFVFWLISIQQKNLKMFRLNRKIFPLEKIGVSISIKFLLTRKVDFDCFEKRIFNKSFLLLKFRISFSSFTIPRSITKSVQSNQKCHSTNRQTLFQWSKWRTNWSICKLNWLSVWIFPFSKIRISIFNNWKFEVVIEKFLKWWEDLFQGWSRHFFHLDFN